MKNASWTRYILILLVFVLLSGSVGVRMISIQNIPAAQVILEKSKNLVGVTQTIYPERGSIYDSQGRLLAGNETVYEVGLDLRSIAQPETIAAVASSVLGLDYSETLVYAKTEPIENQKLYIVLDSFVEKEKIEQLELIEEDYKTRPIGKNETRPSLEGLIWTPYNKRSYPEGDVAANLLGFYSFLDRVDGRGYYGVEEAYNDLLAGTPKQVYTPFDPQKISSVEDIPPGASLVLTIDREIQAMVEEQLAEAIEWSGAESGTIVVYNPEDGSIIAMATTPRMDPNYYWTQGSVFPGSTPFNRPISETYEPGSVFKVITMASALDAGAVKPDTIFNDTGSIMVG
ncbi:MAG TPA: penicillin-binding transpeptidase domain-containing protein, partial [Anaerolineaceae bacterium]|nr:penicillin-binding transpeptidase domain-containing protein [Anaerolineaceae bacterium]